MAQLLFVLGLVIVGVNVYVSWIRSPLIKKLRPDAAVRWVSGIPLIGSAALWLSAWLLPDDSRLVPIALGVSLFDSGGPHWFIATLAWHALQRKRSVDGS